MSSTLSPLQQLRVRLSCGDIDPVTVCEDSLARANQNAARNVYLELDREAALADAKALPSRFPSKEKRPALYGLPVSLKDCFDMSGCPTSCGSRFYAEQHGVAKDDSWVAERLRNQGAVIVGKTHLHQLAYGITGENADYGDCTQPREAARLTGGSSSGAAASVQEGSAVAAIGTDTGGSIRAPAALCGLAGYRSSLGLGDWRGGSHLAPSFDTLGWLFRDLRDGQLLAHALLDVPIEKFPIDRPVRIGSVDEAFLHDCDPQVLKAFQRFQQALQSRNIVVDTCDTSAWNESFDIFAPIQANEAAALHAGYFDYFEPAIAERLVWGASITADAMGRLRTRHLRFTTAFAGLFDIYDFLMLPCCPVGALVVGGDHSAAREKILRYTTPASLAGTPVVAIPLEDSGVQLIGRHGSDAKLLAFAAYLGESAEDRFPRER